MDLTNPSLRDMILDIANYNHPDTIEFIAYDADDAYVYPKKIIEIKPAELLSKSIDDLVREHCSGKEVLGFSSRLKIKEMTFHTPQIDFVGGVPKLDHKEVVEFLSGIYQTNGFVLDSGNSYHYQGRGALPPENWREVMKNLKNYKDIIDILWIQNALDFEFSDLRICADVFRPAPRIIADLH